MLETIIIQLLIFFNQKKTLYWINENAFIAAAIARVILVNIIAGFDEVIYVVI